MIAMHMINWQPMETLPEDRKDGRQVLLWIGEAVVARWADRWSAGEQHSYWNAHFFSEMDGLPEPVVGSVFWADINPPFQ